ncbi:phosphotransferase [Candidatus Nephthysia bennettiae]|uniref:phosphotransferase n=1 Tax=Candidatus Nephthysia bennettiae TaxID=3127016 RepID=UPI0030C76FF7
MTGGGPEPLLGGNVSAGVVRVGDTVRRPAGPWTPAVHALLNHLHGAGFGGAPLPLGVDDQGREVLSFVPGTVPWPDHFELLEPEERLVRAARLIREFHDAVAGFSPPAGAAWQVLIPAEGDEIIAHNDLAPWNMVLGDAGWAFIDWDVAAPGGRLWDLAYALHGFVPLSGDPGWLRLDQRRRLRAFVDAYELDEPGRRELVPMLGRRARSMHDFLEAAAAEGREPWARLWRQGHGATWRQDSEYIEQRSALWETALLG